MIESATVAIPVGGYAYRTADLFFNGGEAQLFSAVRSSISTSGQVVPSPTLRIYSGRSFSGAPRDGVLLGSSDNWVPGVFEVAGVNGGDAIFGWLQVEFGADFDALDPTIVSFTYDDEATDATPFLKPVGGFAITVPEPSSLPLLTLLALGAGGLRRHRKCTSESSKSD